MTHGDLRPLLPGQKVPFSSTWSTVVKRARSDFCFLSSARAPGRTPATSRQTESPKERGNMNCRMCKLSEKGCDSSQERMLLILKCGRGTVKRLPGDVTDKEGKKRTEDGGASGRLAAVPG